MVGFALNAAMKESESSCGCSDILLCCFVIWASKDSVLESYKSYIQATKVTDEFLCLLEDIRIAQYLFHSVNRQNLCRERIVVCKAHCAVSVYK